MGLPRIFWLTGILVLLGIQSPDVGACSSFSLPQSTFTGRNFDWHVGHGQILVNKRNTKKKSLRMFDTDQSVDWVARLGSVTFNQIALDHPASGMNEAGLTVVACQNFGEGNSKATQRPTLNEYQWVQYQLDNYSTVKEVIEHMNDIGISSLLQELHYLVCDASKECAALEVSIAQHQLKVFSGEDFRIQALTDTSYLEAMKKFLSYESSGAPKLQIDPFDSSDRFLYLAIKLSAVRALSCGPCSFESVFCLLAAVKQPGFTQWQIAFDSGTKKIQYKTESTTGIGYLDLAAFDFSSDTIVQAVDIHEYIKNSPKSFHAMTHEDNVRLVDESMSYLGSVLPVGGDLKLKSYPVVLDTAVIHRVQW